MIFLTRTEIQMKAGDMGESSLALSVVARLGKDGLVYWRTQCGIYFHPLSIG